MNIDGIALIKAFTTTFNFKYYKFEIGLIYNNILNIRYTLIPSNLLRALSGLKALKVLIVFMTGTSPKPNNDDAMPVNET